MPLDKQEHCQISQDQPEVQVLKNEWQYKEQQKKNRLIKIKMLFIRFAGTIITADITRTELNDDAVIERDIRIRKISR